MNRPLVKFLFACAAILPASASAQAPAPVIAPGTSTGILPGVTPMKGQQNTQGFPQPLTTPSQPVETRTPEKTDDKPAFAGQTRAPFQPTAPCNVTALADQLRACASS